MPEDNLVEILKTEGIDEAAFSDALKEVSKKGEESDSSFYVQLLISLADYENFISMMQGYKLSAQ